MLNCSLNVSSLGTNAHDMIEWFAVDADMIFETSAAEAQCVEALAEAEKAGTEAERATKHAQILAEQARATTESAEQARAGASEVQAAAARVCAAPTMPLLLWQVEYMPGDSDSSRRTSTAPATTAPTPAPTLQCVDAEAAAKEAKVAATRACSAATNFSIVSGPCLLETNGTCVATPNFPSPYGPNENCNITMTGGGFVSTTSFATESHYDWLTVDGARYGGSNGPFNQAVSSGATVTWESDRSVQNQGWRLCYSAEAPPTLAPTTAPPTTPTLPARPALSTTCSVHVSSTSGTDSETCGESTNSACKSIQKGIDRAGHNNTICVHKGIFGCETGWAGSITQSMMLLGFDAVVDCNGAGGAFQIGYGGAVEEVVISGFHISNAVGGTLNRGFAGGVDALNTQNVSVSNTSFGNCTGQEAGAISVHANSDSNRNNVRTFLDLTISNCYGGVHNTRPGGGAGSISVSYMSNNGNSVGNVHTLSNLQISNSSGGTNTQAGGAAGSISISYYSYGSNYKNVHLMSNLQISNSSGGTDTVNGGAAGSISVSYHCDNMLNGQNVHTLSNLQISNSYGGTNTLNGGAAGSISVSYYSKRGSNMNNTHTMSNLQISNSAGGINTQSGGAAGSISISYYTHDDSIYGSSNSNNVHTMSNLQISNSSGGTNAQSGGAAGSISVSYSTHRGHSNNNVHTLSNSQISNSRGGINTEMGAGALAIAYKGKHADNNTHTISNFTIRDCMGGDPTQGAGAIALQSLAKTSGLNVTIQDSVFAFNQALSDRSELSPLTGVAGAVRIYAKSTDLETFNHAQFINTHFHSNSLDASCASSLCMAGALAVSIQASVEKCIFDSNSCPRGSGALHASRVLNLTDSHLTNNTASQVLLASMPTDASNLFVLGALRDCQYD